MGAEGFSAATTESEPLTGKGTLLGTLQYMAPEQLEGKDTDGRTDVFAFGAIVYEMVTGDRVFKGDSQASLIACILDSHPSPLSSIEPITPLAWDRVVAKCLMKDPDDRWHSAHDLTDEFKWIAQERTLPAPSVGHHQVPGTHVSSGRGIYTVGVAVLVIATVAVVWTLWGTSEPTSLEVTRMTVALPADTQVVQGAASAAIALSPDGTRLVYAAESAGRTQLYLRELDQFIVTALPGTEGARHPFFSPDGDWVGFFADGLLQKIAVSGGLPLTICEAPVVGHGAAWHDSRTSPCVRRRWGAPGTDNPGPGDGC